MESKWSDIMDKKYNWDETKAKEFMSDLRIVKTLSMVGTNKTVLDIGCYTGDIALAIKQKGNRVFALDCKPEFIKMTQEKGIPAKLTNLEKRFPIKPESIDLIVAGEIIEHIYYTERFLRECNRVLKKGGEIIITTPNINWLSFRIQMILGKTLPFGIESGVETDFPGHCRYYTVESLSQTLKNFGFEIEEVRASQIMNKAIKLSWLADKWPSIGYQLIVKAKKI